MQLSVTRVFKTKKRASKDMHNVLQNILQELSNADVLKLIFKPGSL